MAPANEAVGVSDPESGVRDHSVTRLRDVRNIDDLRGMKNTDLPFEMQLLTVAFFCLVLHLCLGPLATVSSVTVISVIHVWSLRVAAGFVGLAVLQFLVRIVS